MDRARRSAEFVLESRSLSTALPLAVLIVVVLAVFCSTLRSEFVYDSTAEILLWDFIHDPGNLLTPLTFRIMGMDVVDFNRPVAVTSLMFDSLLWGKNPFGYHLTNILLHATNTCLVFVLIRHVLSYRPNDHHLIWRTLTVLLPTLIFAIHPLVTEAVCEPSNRKDLLAALFGLTALLLATRHNPQTSRGDALRMFLCPFLCLLAIGSKEVGVAFPAILLLYWILFRREDPVRFWAWTLSLSVAVAVLFLIARFSLAHHPSEIFLVAPGYPGGSLGTALLIQPRILTLYLINVFWPAYLCADYNGYSARFVPLTLSLFVLTAAAILIAGRSIKDKRVLFGAGLILFALLPVCNLVPIYHPMADRYLYLPLIGLALLVAVGLDSAWLCANAYRQVIASLLAVLVIGCLIPVTLERERVWSSELALWQDTLLRNPESFAARANLPEALMLAGRLEEAKSQSEATLRTYYPNAPWVWFDYALELNQLGDRSGAARAARRAIEIKPDILDVDRMVRTLQCRRDLATEFSQLAASLSSEKR